MTDKDRPSYSGISVLTMTFLLAFFSLQCGKGGHEAAKKESPAKVENAVAESKLSQITLTKKAEERLGIETVAVEQADLPGSVNLGGEILAVPGNESLVTAPSAGTVLAPESGVFPTAGQLLKRGQPIMRLMLFPPEKDLLSAREDVAVKREQLNLAQSKADRTAKLLASRAVSEKANEEAQAALVAARAALKTAEERFNLMSGGEVSGKSEGISSLVLKSPADGVLLALHVSRGQAVPASTLLFETAGLSRVWVKVGVYVGELSKIDPESTASVTLLDLTEAKQIFQARPIAGPPLSDAASASSFLYYELENRDGIFRPGQRVGVSLIKKAFQTSLSLPWSAVLYDMYGGTWVYVKTSPLVYSRRRVEVGHIIGDKAVITRGVEAGDEVVSQGAAEIFGTEFGVGK